MQKRHMVLKSKRLILKSLSDNDYDSLIQMATDPLVNATYMFPTFKNDEEKIKFFERIKKISQDENQFLYGIYLNDELIGMINKVTEIENTIEVGYFIKSAFWHHGYATEALQIVIDELFMLGIKRVKAGHFEENLASGKVMQKCGMQKIEETEDIEYRGIIHHCIFYQIENTK